MKSKEAELERWEGWGWEAGPGGLCESAPPD